MGAHSRFGASSGMEINFQNDELHRCELFQQRNNEIKAKEFIRRCDYDELSVFLEQNITEEMYHRSQFLDYARIKLCIHRGEIDWCKYYLQHRYFAQPYHRELQMIWNLCLYKEDERRTGKMPCHAKRWRIRAQQRYPFTIWDGLPLRYNYRIQDIQILEETFIKDAFPSLNVRQRLLNQTYLSMQEIDKWFRNRRGREGKKTRRTKNTRESTVVAKRMLNVQNHSKKWHEIDDKVLVTMKEREWVTTDDNDKCGDDKSLDVQFARNILNFRLSRRLAID